MLIWHFEFSSQRLPYFKHIFKTAFLKKHIQHDDILERQGPRGMTWKTNPIPINPDLAKSTKYSLHDGDKGDKFQPKLFQRQTEEEETEHYTRLCRGEKLRV
jgi:hypothetical protein